jgi:CubicO group peptidase (beta-lactamase class C family)
MTTDQLDPDDPGPDPTGAVGWGFGVGVQRRPAGPGRSARRYGWDGGLGSSWANDPSADLVGVILTNQMWSSPEPPAVVDDFWEAADAAMGD